jgi:hypothetical protein
VKSTLPVFYLVASASDIMVNCALNAAERLVKVRTEVIGKSFVTLEGLLVRDKGECVSHILVLTGIRKEYTSIGLGWYLKKAVLRKCQLLGKTRKSRLFWNGVKEIGELVIDQYLGVSQRSLSGASIELVGWATLREVWNEL